MILIQIFYITIFGRHNIIIGIILGLAAVGFLKEILLDKYYIEQ